MMSPASQNLLIETREECDKPGTMCACVADVSSHGMSKLQVCVDCKVAPFGSVIVMGLVLCCLLMTWACSMMKWPVVPESPKA